MTRVFMTEKKGEKIGAALIIALVSFWLGMLFMSLYQEQTGKPVGAVYKIQPQRTIAGPDSIAQAWLNGMADISVKADTLYRNTMVYYTVDANHLRLKIYRFLPEPFEQAEHWEFYAHDITGKTVFSHITVHDTGTHQKIYNLTKYHKP